MWEARRRAVRPGRSHQNPVGADNQVSLFLRASVFFVVNFFSPSMNIHGTHRYCIPEGRNSTLRTKTKGQRQPLQTRQSIGRRPSHPNVPGAGPRSHERQTTTTAQPPLVTAKPKRRSRTKSQSETGAAARNAPPPQIVIKSNPSPATPPSTAPPPRHRQVHLEALPSAKTCTRPPSATWPPPLLEPKTDT